MQSFRRPGGAALRDRLGAQLLDLSGRHELGTFTVLGHLVRMQALAGMVRPQEADAQARAAEAAAREHESPVTAMLTAWYWAMRGAETASAADAAQAYRAADRRLGDVDMPGVRAGLLPLALLCLRVRHDRPLDGLPGAGADAPLDRWGPYRPWVAPVLALHHGRRATAARLAAALPDPRPDHLRELLWALSAHVAVQLESVALARRAHAALSPAVGEDAGAGSGLVSLGPVREWTDRLSRFL